MITETDYLNAIKIVQQYNDQIKNQFMNILLDGIYIKTPKEIGKYELRNFFSVRICNILWLQLQDTRICDIKKHIFLNCRNAGEKNWKEFYKIVQN